MTDKEIIKALECCSQKHGCRECVLWEMHSAQCVSDLLSNVLSLIKSQKAEIERLQQKYELSEAEREANVKGFTKSLATAKSEAIKEFASKLTPRLLKEMDEQGLMPSAYVKKAHAYTEIELFINEIIKEMTESQ
jgi:predicted FMN-binding regulatory protein PaiB